MILKPVYQRIIAILLLCLPGALGVYGWTLIRDVTFDAFAGQGMNWVALIGGSVCLGIALFVIGGFIFYRDKKHKRVDPRLAKSSKEPK